MLLLFLLCTHTFRVRQHIYSFTHSFKVTHKLLFSILFHFYLHLYMSILLFSFCFYLSLQVKYLFNFCFKDIFQVSLYFLISTYSYVLSDYLFWFRDFSLIFSYLIISVCLSVSSLSFPPHSLSISFSPVCDSELCFYYPQEFDRNSSLSSSSLSSILFQNWQLSSKR